MTTGALLLRGSFLRVVELVVAISVGMFMLPFMLRQLGEDTYGLWILVGGLTASMYLVDAGLASAVARYVGDAMSKKQSSSVNRIVSTSFAIYTVMGLVILLATVALAYAAPRIEKLAHPGQLVTTLILIVGLGIAIEFPFKAFAGIPRAALRFDLIAISRLVFRLLYAALVITFLLLGYDILSVALIGFTTQLLSNFVLVLISKHIFPELSLSFDGIDLAFVRELFAFSSWVFLIDLSSMLRQKGDLIVIGLFLGPGTLIPYYVAVRLADYVYSLLLQITNISFPLFVRYNAEQNVAAIEEKLFIFSRINIAFAAAALTLWLAIGGPLLRLWMGPTFDWFTALQCLVLLTVARLSAFLSTPHAGLLMAIGKHQITAKFSIAEAILSLLTIFLLLSERPETTTVAFAVAVPAIIIRLILLPIYACKAANISFIEQIREIGMLVISFLALALVTFALIQVTHLSDWARLALGSLFVGSLSLAIGLSVMRLTELQYVISAMPTWARSSHLISALLRLKSSPHQKTGFKT